MYSIYQIYQADKLVYTTYHTMNPEYPDRTKLDLILQSPAIPYYLASDYFKAPEQFSIQLLQTSLSNALQANEVIQSLLNPRPSLEQAEVEPQPKKKPRRSKKKIDQAAVENTTK